MATTTTPARGCIPEVPPNKRIRQISTTLRTIDASQDGWVCAEFRSVDYYADPNVAPVWARMTAPGLHHANPDTWEGELVLQMFSQSEVGALLDLAAELDKLFGRARDADVCRALSVELAMAKELGQPFEQWPFPRGHKPRRRRLKWKDEHGKRVHIYQDNLSRSAAAPIPTQKKK